MRRAISLIVLSISVLSALTGCQNQQEGPAPYKKRDRLYRKIVSLSPSTTEIMAAGMMITPVGRTAADNYPEMSVRSIPIVATTKPDYEKITSMAPDLIVYDGALYSDAERKKMEATGAGIFKIDANTLAAFKEQVYELGSLVAAELSASSYVDKINVALGDGKGMGITPETKVAILMASKSGQHYIAGTESFDADLVKQLGATPVGPSGSLFVLAGPESLIQANPDVIIASGTKADVSGAEALLKDPRFKTINAIKNKKVRLIETDVLIRRGGRVDQLIAALARSIAGN